MCPAKKGVDQSCIFFFNEILINILTKDLVQEKVAKLQVLLSNWQGNLYCDETSARFHSTFKFHNSVS